MAQRPLPDVLALRRSSGTAPSIHFRPCGERENPTTEEEKKDKREVKHATILENSLLLLEDTHTPKGPFSLNPSISHRGCRKPLHLSRWSPSFNIHDSHHHPTAAAAVTAILNRPQKL
jgi:hypothetical protein